MPKTDPVVKTIPHAKELSLQKWHKIRKDLEALLKYIGSPCGFCYYNFTLQPYGCLECLVKDKCHEVDIQVWSFLEGSLKYIEEDLIPYLKNFEPNGEAS